MNDHEGKPTVDQIAWVFECLMQSWNESGSYRYLLEIMGVDNEPEAYEKLLAGLEINNALMLDRERRHSKEAT
jgi:hypothetical protein